MSLVHFVNKIQTQKKFHIKLSQSPKAFEQYKPHDFMYSCLYRTQMSKLTAYISKSAVAV